MGLFDWLFHRKHRRRAEIAAGPFPREWERILSGNVDAYSRLPADQPPQLQKLVQVFVAEKKFIGSGGVQIDDEIKVTVAGQACILLLGLPELGVYPRVHEIIVYPHDFGEVVEAVGPDGRRYRIPAELAGQAWHRGPVVLDWDSVEHSVYSPCDGYNVVYHEFAHALDMQSGGRADGIPPLATKEQLAAWSRVFDAAYSTFREAAQRGEPTFIDPYGASSPAEFFAVVTEHFFEQPRRMRAKHPELYEQLRLFYRQDPVRWQHPRTGHWA